MTLTLKVSYLSPWAMFGEVAFLIIEIIIYIFTYVI